MNDLKAASKYLAAWLVLWMACLLAFAIALVVIPVSASIGSGKRAWRLVVSADQTGNVLAGGMVDEMISARAYRIRGKDSRWVRVIDWLALQVAGEKGHCKAAFETEYRRAQLPEAYRIRGG